jgi:hypothetical protein
MIALARAAAFAAAGSSVCLLNVDFDSYIPKVAAAGLYSVVVG